MESGMRKDCVSPFLNTDPAQFLMRSAGELSAPVQVKEIPEQIDRRLFLQVHLGENLKITDIGNRIGPYVLRVKLEGGKCIPEKL